MLSLHLTCFSRIIAPCLSLLISVLNSSMTANSWSQSLSLIKCIYAVAPWQIRLISSWSCFPMYHFSFWFFKLWKEIYFFIASRCPWLNDIVVFFHMFSFGFFVFLLLVFDFCFKHFICFCTFLACFCKFLQ